MNNYHGLFLVVLFFIFICFGCTEESKTITINIESFSPYEATGYVTVDGIHIQNFTLSLFNTTSCTIQKSLLPV